MVRQQALRALVSCQRYPCLETSQAWNTQKSWERRELPVEPIGVVGLSLYLVGTPRLTLTPVVREPGSEVETDAVEWDARVSVLWDHMPGEDPQ